MANHADLLSEHGTWDKVVEVLELQLDTDPDDAARAASLAALARILEDELKRSDDAIVRLEELAELAIDDHASMDRLASLYRSNQRWEDLVTLQIDRTDVAPDATARALLLLDAAGASATGRQDVSAAALLLKQVLITDSHSPEVLSAIETQVGSWPGDDVWADVLLDRIAELADGGTGATAHLHAFLGRLFQSAGRLERARAHMEQAVAAAPEDDARTLSLLELLQALDDTEAQLELVERRTQGTANAAMVPWLLRHAALASRSEPAAALTSLRRAFEVAPDDETVVNALDVALSQSTECLAERIRLFQQRAARALANASSTHSSSEQSEPPAVDADAAEPSTTHLEQAASLLASAAELARTAQPIDPALISSLMSEALTARWTAARFDLAWDWAAAPDMKLWRLDLALKRQSLAEDDPEHTTWGLHAADAALAAGDQEQARRVLEDLHARTPEHEEVMLKLLPLLDATAHLDARESLLRHMLEVEAFAEHEAVWRLELAGLLEPHDLAGAYATLLPLAADDPELLGRLAAMARELDRPEESMRWLAAQAARSEDAFTPLVELATLRAGQPEEIGAWKDVLALRPDHRPALNRLHQLFRTEQLWAELAAVIQTLASLSTDPDDRARLLVELGDLNRKHLAAEDVAWELFEEALVLSPNSVSAAEPLLERAIANLDWARIPHLVDLVLAEPAVGEDPNLRLLLMVQKATALEELAREQDAVDAWRQVLSLDSDHSEAHRALATLLLDLQLPGEAATHFEKVLSGDLSSETDADRVALFYQAGTCAVLINDFYSAANRFTNALLIEPYHLPTLNALANQSGFGSSDLRIQAHERLLLTTEDPLVQFRLLVALGDLCVDGEHLDDAINAYKRAVDIDGSSRVVLHKLLQLFSDREQWQLAAEVLGKLASLEMDPGRRKKLLLTIAALFRDQLGDPIQAAAIFNRILDEQPEDLETFQALDAMLMDARQYAELERAYRRMLERAGDKSDESLRFTLFRNLGRIYANFLHDRMQAAASFDLALRLVPDHEATWSEWIALYPTDGSADDTLTDILQRAIASAPALIDSYHALFDIACHRRLFDRALRLAAALDVMGQATPEEADFYTQLQPRTLPLASTPISNAQWRLLHHPDLDPRICLLVQTLSQTVATTLATGLDRWGLSRRNAINLQQSHPITNLFVYTSQVLSVDLPELIVSPGLVGLFNAHAAPRAIIVGNDVHTGDANRRMVFKIAHAMTMMRPEFYLASAYGSRDWLKALIYGALATVTGTLIPDPSEEQVMVCFRAIERQSQPVLDQIAQSVSGLFADDQNPDVSAWFRAMDYTAGRVGLLLCGDLSRALQAVQDTPESFSGLSVAARCSDLVQFSLSPEYEQVRAELRLGAGQQ